MGDFPTLLASIRSSGDKGTYGNNFEQFCCWFLRHDSMQKSRFSKVYLWKDYPDRWRKQDIGIDIVAITIDGELYAIQCKCYEEDFAVTKNDISKFLAAEKAAPENIKFAHHLLMVSNKKPLHYYAQDIVKQDNMYVINGFDFEKSENINYPSDISEIIASNKVRYHPPKTPREHQTNAIDAVKAGFSSGVDRGQLVMACGTGKTYTSLWIKEALEARHVLVLVPSLILLGQMLREWKQQDKHDFAYLCVCSDDNVDRDADDQPVSSQRSYSVTGDVEEIAQFMRKRNDNGVIFCTYHSSEKIVLAQQQAGAPAFDLAIADEAHRCAVLEGSNQSGDNYFKLILDAEKIRSRRRLFMTATPRIHKMRKRKDDEDVDEITPEAGFGEVFYRYSFADAIDDGQLSDYKLVLIGVDDAMLKACITEGKHQVAKEHIKDMAAWVGIQKAIEEYQLERLISFHSRVNRAQAFAKSVKEWSGGKVQADYVSGVMNSLERSKRLEDLKRGDISLLANARCLSEGVDVPSLDAIAFIDPKRSQVDIVQAVGRAIRKSEDKKYGYIVMPVYLTSYEDAEEQLLASAFEPIWQTVRALKSHDAKLAEEINGDEFLRQCGRFTGGFLSEKIDVWLPDDYPSIDRERLESALYSRLVEVTAESWQVSFQHLRSYCGEEGHANPPSCYKTPSGNLLGAWVSNQRTAKKNILSAERITKLESLPGWVWDVLEVQWQQGFDALKAYTKEEGHANPPKSYKTPSGNLLERWVSKQRTAKKNNTLSAERITKLESLPGWVWDALALEEKWQQGFDALKNYAEEEGHANPPKSYKTPSGNLLGQWVGRQRTAKKNNILSAERITKLESLPGWVWDVLEVQWQQGFDALKAYTKEEGHANPPQNYKTPSGNLLGQWVGNQRAAKKKKTLSAERITKLEALAGWVWDALEAQWQQGFDALQTYTKEAGHANPPQNYKTPSGNLLGQWVGSQRAAKKNNILSAEKITKLESLPGWVWDALALEAQWQQGFDALKAYTKEEGHANPPKSYKTPSGNLLGQWVGSQRAAKKNNILSAERITKLESLPGWVWDALALEEKWQQGFDALKNYAEEEGHANPPKSYKTPSGNLLGQWVGRQRTAKKNNILSAERITKLESLPGWVWDALALEEKWQQGFDALQTYTKEEGHANPPHGYKTASTYRLGAWVGRQRTAKKNNILSAERITKLESLPGWVWDALALEEKWQQGFDALQTYTEEEGHANPPKSYKTPSGNLLGQWVGYQRQVKKNNILPAERITQLESLNGWTWDAKM